MGDIGDNGENRPFVTVHRFLEPAIDPNAVSTPLKIQVKPESARFKYEDAPHDSEAMWVDPTDASLYFVTKRTPVARIYQGKWPKKPGKTTQTLQTPDESKQNPDKSDENTQTVQKPDENKHTLDRSDKSTQILHKVGSIPMKWVTAADISPSGNQIIIRNYNQAMLWHRPEDENIADALAKSGQLVPLEAEKQGEAICFAADGKGYFTVSEKKRQPIYYYACKGVRRDSKATGSAGGESASGKESE
ncbi:hypothetical protein [Anaerohalosphaera lusitana]|uniref:hypothetical protein n=1 Tax=Anaerohalosphaera lusitana TaxID=1936003 RepID=UPI00197C88A7|nr:hypothetical protein [Anaerohalosphaera lusitana]